MIDYNMKWFQIRTLITLIRHDLPDEKHHKKSENICSISVIRVLINF
jgi:hypothetical protein